MLFGIIIFPVFNPKNLSPYIWRIFIYKTSMAPHRFPVEPHNRKLLTDSWLPRMPTPLYEYSGIRLTQEFDSIGPSDPSSFPLRSRMWIPAGSFRCSSPSGSRGETGGFWPHPEPRCLVPEPSRCRSSDPDSAVKAAKPDTGISNLGLRPIFVMGVLGTPYLPAAGQAVVPAHKVFGRVHPRQVFPRHAHAAVPLCTVTLANRSVRYTDSRQLQLRLRCIFVVTSPGWRRGTPAAARQRSRPYQHLRCHRNYSENVWLFEWKCWWHSGDKKEDSLIQMQILLNL